MTIIKSDSRLLVDLSADGGDYSVGRTSTSLGRSAVSFSPFRHKGIQKEKTPSNDMNDDDERSEVSSLTGASLTSMKRTPMTRSRPSRNDVRSSIHSNSMQITRFKMSGTGSILGHARTSGGSSARSNAVHLERIVAPTSPVSAPNNNGKIRKKPPSIITTGLDGLQQQLVISPLP